MITRARAREQENRRRLLIIFLRIPSETWTDVFKLFPRRTLVQRISPVCYRLKEICNRNVKTIHEIKEADRFNVKLRRGDPEAKRQLEHLAGNDCQLSSQFRLLYFFVIQENKAILRHCLDLFNGCEIAMLFEEKNKNSTFFLEYLGQLQEAKPVDICIGLKVDQIGDFWQHPTFQHCNQILLGFHSQSSLSAATMMTVVKNISEWLHHQPIGAVCDASAGQQVRCMIFWIIGQAHGPIHIDWLINHCSENIQQSQQPTDRRPYVLSFECFEWTGFGQFHRIENKSTGETLVLDRVMDYYGKPPTYRLRRCLAEDEANGPELYARMFERHLRVDAFNIEDKTPKVKLLQ